MSIHSLRLGDFELNSNAFLIKYQHRRVPAKILLELQLGGHKISIFFATGFNCHWL